MINFYLIANIFNENRDVDRIKSQCDDIFVRYSFEYNLRNIDYFLKINYKLFFMVIKNLK